MRYSEKIEKLEKLLKKRPAATAGLVLHTIRAITYALF
jgi:hypothetical protein